MVKLLYIHTIMIVLGAASIPPIFFYFSGPLIYHSDFAPGACELLTRYQIDLENLRKCPNGTGQFPCLQISARFYKNFRPDEITEGPMAVNKRSLNFGCFLLPDQCGSNTTANVLMVSNIWEQYRARFLYRDHFPCYGNIWYSQVLYSVEGLESGGSVLGVVVLLLPSLFTGVGLLGLIVELIKGRRGERKKDIGAVRLKVPTRPTVVEEKTVESEGMDGEEKLLANSL